jgi:hypothetical protein
LHVVRKSRTEASVLVGVVVYYVRSKPEAVLYREVMPTGRLVKQSKVSIISKFKI